MRVRVRRGRSIPVLGAGDVPEAGGVVENGVAVLEGGRVTKPLTGISFEDAAVGWGRDDPDEVAITA